MDTNSPSYIFKRASADGAIMGACFVAFFACMVFSSASPLVSFLGFILMCVPPFLLFYLLRRSRVAADGDLTFSQLWLEGTFTMVLGAIFLAIVAYVYLRWINPTFLIDQVTESVKILSQMGSEYSALTESMQSLLEDGNMPSPLQVSWSMIQSAFITGAILAAIVAAIVKSLKINPKFHK
ncbi:MAG: DUF4199 domain-containing protein [Muribaculaceae bacterium]|nr:DUF4199 domain-containing protein [Muribaculaceae bacterium]MBP5315896.1 DUF4199 domain-containing protein [Muribaculaceae bacterium]MBR4721742.1 DUF4199 domain-containing protein [Muribaculaceae bacterium]MBR5437009.1 DUF4199 domain-containing protein [Muribaculaceae bacterium]